MSDSKVSVVHSIKVTQGPCIYVSDSLAGVVPVMRVIKGLFTGRDMCLIA